MRRRRGQGNIAASPVLIGATTVLIALVAVFIAYNANSGLPFVPTYQLNAELPSGGKLVKGNEVRVGGFRVGVVKEVTPEVRMVNGERRAMAVANLSLDKKLEPLARITIPGDNVRPMGVAVSPDGARVYVATGRGRSVVAIGSTAAGSVPFFSRAIASSSLRRCPIDVTPRAIRSSAVSRDSNSASISLARKAWA